MYNTNLPNENELPSNKQLISSTLIAIGVAGALLITCVLPAEYGIDPTGIGKTLGLTKMGEIKVQLEAEAEADKTASLQNDSPIQVEDPVADSTLQTESTTSLVVSETIEITLSPGAAAEVKVNLSEGETVSYEWSVNKGHLNFDNHGDNASTSYHNYSKGKAVTSDKGEIKAAFDGSHGWFWRNRSSENVTVTLTAKGEEIKLKRVL